MTAPGPDRSPAEDARREAVDEGGVPRSHLRDLVALLALPALWKEKDQERIAGDVIDLLVSLLRLDCAFVCMTDIAAGETVEHAWPESCEISREVAGALQATAGVDAAPLRASAAPAPGGGMLRLVRVEQRFPGEDCVVVVGARRASFPTSAEGFLLQVAADQAAIAVHGARLLAREQAAREEAELRAAQMSLAAEVGAAVAGAAELDGMLRRCADAMARNLDAACAGIWTLAGGEVLVLRARAGRCGFSARHERVPLGAHKVGRIAQERRPYLTNRLQRDPLVTDAGWAGRNRLTAFAGYPLVVEDRLIGVLGVYADRPLREEALDLMGGVADTIATGIERKRVEEGLAAQQEWLESLLDILPVGVALIEPGTAKILLSNKAADRIAGGVFPKPESRAEYDELRFYCTDARGKRVPRDQEPGNRVARGETLRGLEIDWQTPGGTRSLLINSDVVEAAHGHQATAVAAFEDVTELKSMQVALSVALEDSYRFVSVVEESSEFMGIATLEGKVIFVNSAGQRLVGIADPAAVPGMTIFDYVFPEDHRLLREAVAAAIVDGQRTGELRFRHVGTGQPIPVWANVFVLRDRRTDQPVALATVTHDLTEEKRNLELRERVLGIVSHDLRNPLNAIMMGASVLRGEPGASKEMVRIASRIVASAERMDAIIGDLLDLTKVRLGGGIELKLAKANAHDLSARVVEELRAANPGREIRLSMSGNAIGRWDSYRLEQVVSNLASNALQYGPEDEPVTLESLGGETEWALSVHNLGDPIPPDLLPHLFDPFRRGGTGGAGKERRNLGLGLFIVRVVVEAHGGTVEVTSARPQGTRFTARLPRRTRA